MSDIRCISSTCILLLCIKITIYQLSGRYIYTHIEIFRTVKRKSKCRDLFQNKRL